MRAVSMFLTLMLGTSHLAAQTSDTFVHTIKSGETIYGIARTYGVSTQEILRLNPGADSGIKAGETLVVPQKKAESEGKLFHTIKSGETLYRLTVLYGVTAQEICSANPGLTAENFRAGMVIMIPASSNKTDRQTEQPQRKEETPTVQTIAQSGCREMHQAKKKETLYSIARQYGISEAELRAANPETNARDYKLRKGDFLCIPYPKVKTPTNAAKRTPSNEELLSASQKTARRQSVVRFGVMLPFKGGTQENEKMVEFYRGALLAVSAMKDAGLSVEVYAYDSGKTAADMSELLAREKPEGLDFVLGPLHSEQIVPLGNYCKQNNIRMVVPLTSLGENFYDNPFCYAVNAPKSFLHSQAAELTKEVLGGANLVVVDGGEANKEALSFINALETRFAQEGKRIGKVGLDDDETKWMGSMNQFKENVLVPNAADIKILNRLFPVLQEFIARNPEYKVKILGYPEWQTFVSCHLENFYRFDTYVFSSFFRNPLGGNAEEFENSYQTAFRSPTLLSYPRFGMLGFDLAMYFMKGVSEYGPALEEHLDKIVTTPYQHRFDFRRVSTWGGFVNREVQFIHYDPERNIELIRLKK